VGRADGVCVAGEMEVEVLHRDHLAVAGAGSSALDAEDRAEARLADRGCGTVADAVEPLGEADGDRGLALAQRSPGYGAHEHVAVARVGRLQAHDGVEVNLALVQPYGLSSDALVPRSAATSAMGRGSTERAISRSEGKEPASELLIARSPVGGRIGAKRWSLESRTRVGGTRDLRLGLPNMVAYVHTWCNSRLGPT